MTILVFGSNREGRHSAGAALEARRNHGALMGQAQGRQGSSYAIVTKELRKNWHPVTLDEVAQGVREFLRHARDNPDDTFMVTAIGCGLAGFEPKQIAPLFHGRPINVYLPPEFR